MTEWMFWTVALLLSAGVLALFVQAMRRGRDEALAKAADLAVYRDQLDEVERDLKRGTLSAEEAERLRAEVGRRVLDLDRADREEAATAKAPIAPVAVILALVVVAGTGLVYSSLGAPGYPDMALDDRIAALDARMATRPAQEARLVELGQPRDAALDAQLATELAAASDPDALRALFNERFETGALQAAVRTQERLIELQGGATSSMDHSTLALALVVEAQGYVAPEAEVQLRESLRRDASNEMARFLVGEMFLQGGRFDQAFSLWRPIAEDGNPDAPWVTQVRERIETVAQLAGVNYTLPESARRGPTGEDMAAAAEMTPEERQAMIEGMVAQLADRLATDGGDVEDWNRLIRSLAILERLPEAQTIYDEAKAKFQGRPAELSFLRLAAVETGLNP
jgi:cytochrome c-type biogenesis protein CcmH